MTKAEYLEIVQALSDLAVDTTLDFDKAQTYKEKSFWSGKECGLITAIAYLHKRFKEKKK